MSRPSLYIAGTYAEVDRVRSAMRAARGAGFGITSTWPDNIAKVGSANPADASVLERAAWASTCLAELGAADAIWFLVPTLPIVTRGAWVELGAASTLRKYLVLSGQATRQSIFCALGEEFNDDASALEHLKAWAADVRLRRGLRELAEWPGEHELAEYGGES